MMANSWYLQDHAVRLHDYRGQRDEGDLVRVARKCAALDVEVRCYSVWNTEVIETGFEKPQKSFVPSVESKRLVTLGNKCQGTLMSHS